ncbi:hypothetical protein GCM10010348_06370 [Streptomyces anthocyanicus]|nr:hypothetical protein JCM4020_06950 [Streptomyces coelicolor]GHB91026.1 hypothetical protein GCM10010348_06370 [Streptomyces anthocyanicus]
MGGLRAFGWGAARDHRGVLFVTRPCGAGGGPSHCPVGRPGRWVARRATEVFRSAPVVGGASAGPRALLLGIRTDSAPADWDPAATLPDHPVRPPGSVLS